MRQHHWMYWNAARCTTPGARPWCPAWRATLPRGSWRRWASAWAGRLNPANCASPPRGRTRPRQCADCRAGVRAHHRGVLPAGRAQPVGRASGQAAGGRSAQLPAEHGRLGPAPGRPVDDAVGRGVGRYLGYIHITKAVEQLVQNARGTAMPVQRTRLPEFVGGSAIVPWLRQAQPERISTN